jgi:NAD(P)-dependent dehydrogenase (short-subunit alcohol dehydrogenase family)
MAAEHEEPPRAALITGASGGVGKALCTAFADAGYHVIATDVAQHSALPHAYLPLDLSALPRNPELQSDLLQRLGQHLTGYSLHACVNNAAVQILGHLDQIEDADFQRTLDINLFAPLVLARLLLPQLEAAGGSIVNIGSIHAQATKPGFVSYATSKAALRGLTQALAVDLGPRVRVNVIQPAAVSTEMLRAGFENDSGGYAKLAAYHPVGRIAAPSEIAQMAVLLASERAAFVSGSAIDMHGGIGVRLHDPD